MSRKEKRDALDAMIKTLEENSKKEKCDKCGMKFRDWMKKWSTNDISEAICIYCHSKYWNKNPEDYYLQDETENLRRVIRIKEEETENDTS